VEQVQNAVEEPGSEQLKIGSEQASEQDKLRKLRIPASISPPPIKEIDEYIRERFRTDT
jgi:hypothetical protein